MAPARRRPEEVLIATAQQCREALDSLLGEIAELDPKQRAEALVNRTLSCEITDLGLRFWTRVGPDGADPAREATDRDPVAQVRFITDSDTIVFIAEDPQRFGRAWVSGKIKVRASVMDVLRLRKFL